MSLPSIFYKVGNTIHHKKINAVLDANSKNEDITWHFFDDIFQKNDWLNEPLEDINTLYYIRARQIRESYDYVVLLCSGGADSTNVLYSFLNQQIFPDEIIVSAPLSGLSNYEFNQYDTNHTNTISETKYAQLPLAQEVITKYPKIKVTLNDYFQNMIDYTNQSWIIDCDDWMHPSSASRYRFQQHKHLVSIAESGKRVAFVYGIDKPFVSIGKNDEIYVSVSDLAYNVMRPPFDNEYTNVENVMFYWDPNNIKCITKQAHIVARNVLSYNNPISMYMLNINKLPKTYVQHRYNQSKYERGIVPYIYPNLESRKVFQAEKPSKLFLGEHDYWFYHLHGKTLSYQMMVSETNSLLKTINTKYLNKGLNGFAVHSKSYKIGNLKNFKNMF